MRFRTRHLTSNLAAVAECMQMSSCGSTDEVRQAPCENTAPPPCEHGTQAPPCERDSQEGPPQVQTECSDSNVCEAPESSTSRAAVKRAIRARMMASATT